MTTKQAPLSKFVKINPEGITQGYPYQAIEYIDISSVGSGQLVEQPEEILLKDAPSRAKRIVRNKDIILATVRPNLRSFLFIKNPTDNTVVSTGFAVLRTKEAADPRFIYYAITDSRFTGYLTNNTKGTSYPAVDSDIVLRGDIPDFDFNRQQYIGEILSAYDDLIDTNRRRIQLLEESARLLFREWFVYFRFPGHEKVHPIRKSNSNGVKIVDGVPEGWEKGPIKKYFDTTSGGTPSRENPEYYQGDINWVKTQELDEKYIFDTEERVTQEAINKSSAKIFPANTLLVSIYGNANIGRTGILANPAASNQACVAFFPKKQHYHYIYLQQYLQMIREFLVGMSQGAAQTNISQDTLRKVNMLMPDELLMNKFIKIAEPMYEQIKNLQFQNQKLAQARDLLLPRLMSGVIDPIR